MAPPKRLYLEASSLRNGGWPTPNARLSALLSTAHGLGIDCFLVDPVDRELESQWIRKYVTACEEWRRGGSEIAGYLGTGDPVPKTAPLPGLDAVRKEYRRRVATAISAFSLQRVPLTETSLDAVFEMALEQSPPFGDRGANFKDAVILLSVLEHLAAENSVPGLLIAEDKVFRQCAEVISDFQVQLEALPLDDAHKLLTGFLNEEERSALMKRVSQLRTFIEGDPKPLETFLLHTLRVPQGWSGRLSVVASPDAVHLVSLNAVVLPPTATSTTPTQRASLQLSLAVRVRNALDPAMEALFSEKAADIYDPAGIAAEAALQASRAAMASASVDVDAEVHFSQTVVDSVKFLSADLRGLAAFLPMIPPPPAWHAASNPQLPA